ncbi:precorrin-6A synthase (deacetylating) [Acidothermaceae bacterium B102]|nr:precorrin-6A synthase (deacetylating) [Acidothermaceae bacterium B102]
MRKLSLVGIGAGNPEYVTLQAVRVLNEVDVVFLVDKGDAKASLVQLREEICARYITDQDGYRVVEIADPPRDRAAERYQDAVDDWRLRRAVLFEHAIARELTDDQHGAFLVWGDPALYDSTLGVIDHILARGTVAFEYEVVPGITSVQALAAAHRIPLNRTAEPIHVTTGRLLRDGLPGDNVVVMLDAGLAAVELDDPALAIYWGAYLGTPDEVLMSGRVVDVARDIERTKRELRERNGWVMDTYLVRRE